jgi:hypothetical protein
VHFCVGFYALGAFFVSRLYLHGSFYWGYTFTVTPIRPRFDQ